MSDANIAELLRDIRARANMSQRAFSKIMGLSAQSSYGRYENVDYMRNRRLPLEMVRKLVVAIAGKGSPPIAANELWALAELKTGLTILPSVVFSIPILGRRMFNFGRQALRTAMPEGAVIVAGLEAGEYYGLTVEDASIAKLAPPGATLIIDFNQIELRDGLYYLMLLNGEASVKRWRANPPRLESVAMPPDEAVYPTTAIEVFGRVVRVITEL